MTRSTHIEMGFFDGVQLDLGNEVQSCGDDHFYEGVYTFSPDETITEVNIQ